MSDPQARGSAFGGFGGESFPSALCPGESRAGNAAGKNAKEQSALQQRLVQIEAVDHLMSGDVKSMLKPELVRYLSLLREHDQHFPLKLRGGGGWGRFRVSGVRQRSWRVVKAMFSVAFPKNLDARSL